MADIWKKNDSDDWIYVENNIIVATYGRIPPTLPINFSLYTQTGTQNISTETEPAINTGNDNALKHTRYLAWIAAGHSDELARQVTGYEG